MFWYIYSHIFWLSWSLRMASIFSLSAFFFESFIASVSLVCFAIWDYRSLIYSSRSRFTVFWRVSLCLLNSSLSSFILSFSYFAFFCKVSMLPSVDWYSWRSVFLAYIASLRSLSLLSSCFWIFSDYCASFLEDLVLISSSSSFICSNSSRSLHFCSRSFSLFSNSNYSYLWNSSDFLSFSSITSFNSLISCLNSCLILRVLWLISWNSLVLAASSLPFACAYISRWWTIRCNLSISLCYFMMSSSFSLSIFQIFEILSWVIWAVRLSIWERSWSICSNFSSKSSIYFFKISI